MGDHFRTGKPPQCRTRQPGQLSLGYPSMDRRDEYPAKPGSKQAHSMVYQPIFLVSQADVWLRGSEMEMSAEVWEAVAYWRYLRRCTI